MPRYLVERQFNVGQEQMTVLGRRSREIARDQFPGITWHHSHVAIDEEGHVQTFCVYAVSYTHLPSRRRRFRPCLERYPTTSKAGPVLRADAGRFERELGRAAS